MHDTATIRIRALSALIVIASLVFIGKLFFIQVIHGGDYREQASRQYISPVSNIFDRGNIFFTKKDGQTLSAATLKTGFTVAINPTLLEDPQGAFAHLVSIIPDIDSDAFFLKAGKKNDPYEEIARRVPKDKAQAVESLDIQGVSIHEEKWRFYPGKTLAAHVLGFVGYDGDRQVGQYGLERYYDYTLRRDEKDAEINLFAEVFANIRNSFLYQGGAQAGDIVLTIEPDVAAFLGRQVEDIRETWNAESAGAIIMDPMTGAVIAMESSPTFNPNSFSDVADYSVFSNPLVESVFEMGSIVKPLTVAAGLDAGAIVPTDTYYDPGFVEVSGARIENFDGKGRGRVPLQEILNQSLNTGAVHVEQKLGKERFRSYFRALGLQEETGIDLPNEASGLAENLESSRDVEYATASFGQGFAVTPISIARALSALGNGGVLVTPYVVSRIDFKEALSRDMTHNPSLYPRVYKKETSETITRMLVTVVDKALVGGTVKLEHYSVAAKTGTAQIARRDGKGYYEDRYLHSFFGYFPAYAPRFLVFLYIENPRGVRFASETLTHPFMDTVKFLIHYYGIPPDR